MLSQCTRSFKIENVVIFEKKTYFWHWRSNSLSWFNGAINMDIRLSIYKYPFDVICNFTFYETVIPQIKCKPSISFHRWNVLVINCKSLQLITTTLFIESHHIKRIFHLEDWIEKFFSCEFKQIINTVINTGHNTS